MRSPSSSLMQMAYSTDLDDWAVPGTGKYGLLREKHGTNKYLEKYYCSSENEILKSF